MANLSFGSFVWPNDPERYEEKCTREPIYTQNDDGTRTFAGMSPAKRTISGSGVFYGAGAYTNFKTLQAFLGQAASLNLIHPVWGTRRVYLTELTSSMEPRDDYVAYTFTFLEIGSALST